MVQIRYATVDDYNCILKIDSSISKQKWESWTANKQAILTFMNNELAGWLQYSFFIEKIPFVNRLYIFEKFQRNSLGTGLMKFWEFEMVERGHTKLMLSIEESDTAQEFYKKLGYKTVGSFDYFSHHNELLLAKEITEFKTCCCR